MQLKEIVKGKWLSMVAVHPLAMGDKTTFARDFAAWDTDHTDDSPFIALGRNAKCIELVCLPRDPRKVSVEFLAEKFDEKMKPYLARMVSNGRHPDTRPRTPGKRVIFLEPGLKLSAENICRGAFQPIADVVIPVSLSHGLRPGEPSGNAIEIRVMDSSDPIDIANRAADIFNTIPTFLVQDGETSLLLGRPD